MRRWLAVAVLCWFPMLAQAPPPSYFVQFSPVVFGMKLPAVAGNPESHCYVWVHLGGFYDTEVACYIAGAFVAPIMAGRAGQGFDGGFNASGGRYIRWLFCNPAPLAAVPAGCPARLAAAPAGLVAPMYFQLAAGGPDEVREGYY